MDAVADGARKKLTDAARHWAGAIDDDEEESDGITDEIADLLAKGGAPDDVVQSARARAEANRKPAGDEFEVWADCWDAFQFFRSLHGQWAYISGMAVVRVGLDFAKVESAMNMQRIRGRNRRQLFEDMKTMEIAVLSVDRELAKKKEDK